MTGADNRNSGPRRGAVLSRRVLLGVGLALPLAACISDTSKAPTTAPRSPTGDSDAALRADALAREQALLLAYDAAVLDDPTTAARLAPLRAEHAAHVAALTGPATGPRPDPAGTAASAAPRAPAAGGTAPGSPGPGSSAGRARPLSVLVAAERTAAAAHGLAARTASPALAQVLASLSASEASHEIALAT